jgi:membrane associated rhomboid family serine protease
VDSESKKEFTNARNSFLFPFFFILTAWAIKAWELINNVSLAGLGIEPRTLHGLIGIILAPLLHGDIKHLLSNSIPLLVLGTALIYFYGRISYPVFGMLWLWIGLLVWMFARPSHHIGASGIIYGLAAFLFFSGFIKKNTGLLAISLLVTIFYGGMVWGILPVSSGISWESHLAGLMVGLLLAWIFKKHGPQQAVSTIDGKDNDNSDPWDIDQLKSPPGFKIRHKDEEE